MRAGMLIVGATVAIALAAAPAAAATGTGFGPDRAVGRGADTVEPVLAAMSLRDDAVVGWTRTVRTAVVRLRPGPRGRWSPLVTLGPGRLAALAMDRTGTALALRTAGGPPRAARILLDGSVRASQLPVGGSGRVLDASLRQDGRAIALVLRPDGVTLRLMVQRDAASAWRRSGPDFVIPGPATGLQLAADVNRAGAAVVAWTELGATTVGAATRYSIGSQWASPATGLPGLRPGGPTVSDPRAVIGDDGSAAVTWIVRTGIFPELARGDGAFITTGPGPTVSASGMTVPAAVATADVSPTGTAMIAWADPALGGGVFASRFAPFEPGWPIGIRRVAAPAVLDEGALALDSATSRRGPVLLVATLETGPAPDGQVAFARDSRGAPWGAARPLAFTRGIPAVVGGERAALIALVLDDNGDVIVTPYDLLAR